ncbi:MAG TPA: hypothetical protein VF647_11025 [Longimicrobium sp.]
MKRVKRVQLRRAGGSITDPPRQRVGGPPEMSDDEIRECLTAAVESVRGVEIEDVFPGGYAELRTQPNAQQTPAWVLRMRERGINVREPLPGAVIEPFRAVRQAGPLLAFWRRAVRRLRESRAVS